MDNNELLSQIKGMFNKHTKSIDKKMDQKLDNQMKIIDKKMIEKLKAAFEDMIPVITDTVTHNVNLFIEKNIGKKIDALFDGYKLNYEKQQELDKKYDSLDKRVENLESEVYALKKKVG